MRKYTCYNGPIMPNLPYKRVSKGGGGKELWDHPENPGWETEGVVGPSAVNVLNVYFTKYIFLNIQNLLNLT